MNQTVISIRSHVLQMTAWPESWMDPQGFIQDSNYVPGDNGKADLMLLGASQRMANKSVDWGLPTALGV